MVSESKSKNAGIRHRERMAARSRKQTEAASDIGAIPPIQNPEIRELCRYDLKLFLVHYFPNKTGLDPFSKDHDKMIDSIQTAILEGGKHVNAVYRGFAKTTISENAAIWATLYGHRRYLVIFCGTGGEANDSLESIKTELSENDLLIADFPEICYPIACLEGKVQRCKSQSSQGRLTHIQWNAERVVFPTVGVDGLVPAGCGAAIATRGMDSHCRGLGFTRPGDLTKQRPDFVILDDIQTDESAASFYRCTKIIKKIQKSILKLGGHKSELSVVMNATVIEPDDVVDQLLSPKKHPEWSGVRIAMVKQFSDRHDDLWMTDYANILSDYNKESQTDKKRAEAEATEFYRKNQKEMDQGCEISWVHCYDPIKELSAIQHAYNILIRDGQEAFDSECQNNPRKISEGAEEVGDPIIFAVKTTGYDKYIVPDGCEVITAAIDVQKRALYYTISAFTDQFDIYDIDYGAWPKQNRKNYAYSDITNTIQRKFRGEGLESQIYKAILELSDQLFERKYKRVDGVEMELDALIVDAGYQTKSVNKACRNSKHKTRMFPCFGKGIKATDKRMMEYKKLPGEKRSSDEAVPWRLLPSKEYKGERFFQFDTNSVKTFNHRRITTREGVPGCRMLFGDERHEMYANHICSSEMPTAVSAKGVEVQQWDLPNSKPDNHFFDTSNMTIVGASYKGVTLEGIVKQEPKKRRKRKKVQYL